MVILPENKYAFGILSAAAVSVVLSLLLLAGAFEPQSLRASDILYEKRSPLDSIIIVAIDDKSLQQIGRWPWDRKVYADFLSVARNAKVVGFDVSFFESSSSDNIFAKALPVNTVLAAEYIFENEERFLVPVFNASYGHVNFFQDSDGVVRSVPLSMKTKSFSLAVAERYVGAEINTSGKALINFIGPAGTFRTISFSDAMNGTDFNGKIVLVGATAKDLHDERLTPFSYSQPMPGVEIHANVIQMLVTGSRISSQSIESVVLVIFIFALLTSIIVSRFKIIFATIVIVAIALLYIYISALIFSSGIVMNIFYPFIAMAAVYIIDYIYFYHAESKKKRQITGIFGKYVSKEVVDEILKKTKAEKIEFGGTKKEITIMFSDIRDFTGISEKMTPEKLVELLNEYLSSMSNIIMQKRGIIDKYIGDAVMAFWGAPLDEKEHAALACEAALEMKAALNKMKNKISIGIGINTGDAIVGNMGSSQRINYTVIGDAVNIASRIEGLNKIYGTTIIVSESTMKQVSGFVFRRLDKIKVKGKTKAVQIYELVGRANEHQ
ncbi:MAG: adenylate/guanylate cyclase domain-containing protein [Candidatus Aenigmatarchaeota archaeon]